MEGRMIHLERQHSDLRERVTRIEGLEEMIGELRTDMRRLTDALNRGKGAVWVVATIGIAAGTVIHWLLNQIGRG